MSEHNDIARAVAGEKFLLRPKHRRMDDRLQRGEFVAIAEHQSAEFLPVDATGSGGAGKARLDRRDERAGRPLQPMHFGVGVEHRHPLRVRTSLPRSTYPSRSSR